MGYNNYMTVHVVPNKYFYIRGGIIQKNRNISK